MSEKPCPTCGSRKRAVQSCPDPGAHRYHNLACPPCKDSWHDDPPAAQPEPEIRKAADETQRFVMASLGIEYDEYTGYTIIAEPEPIEAGESFREAIGEYVKFQNKLADQAESAESELAALRERVKELEADAGRKGSQ